MKIAIIGATGLVGQKMIEILAERNFPLETLIPVASERSVGKKISYNGKQVEVIGIDAAIKENVQIAMFSADDDISLAYAEQFAASGATVIDNSSAWRMSPSHKLIVPEINADQLTAMDKIIANPNCSTIQLLMAIGPIHKKFGIERLIISTYQSVSGTGIKAVEQLKNEQKGIEGEKVYAHPIHENCIPQCDDFTENGYTKEEMKLVNEPRKILNDNSIKITATAVRIPQMGGHAESVNLSLKSPYRSINEIKHLLEQSPGIVVQDEPTIGLYPMPTTAHNKDDVFVGRIRKDESQENGLNLWIVADNLRKGAATNSIQIAEYLVKHKLV